MTVALPLSCSSGVTGGSAAVVVVVRLLAVAAAWYVAEVYGVAPVVVVVLWVVVVVDEGDAFFGAAFGTAVSLSTGRNRSSAVRPTRRWALLRSFTPGRSTTIVPPVR